MTSKLIVPFVIYVFIAYMCHNLAYENSHYRVNDVDLPKLKMVSNFREITHKIYTQRAEAELPPNGIDVNLFHEFIELQVVLEDACQIWQRPIFREEKGCVRINPCVLNENMKELVEQIANGENVFDEVQTIFDASYDPRISYVHLAKDIDNYLYSLQSAFQVKYKEMEYKPSLKLVIPKYNETVLVNVVAEQFVTFINNHFTCIFEKVLPPFKENQKPDLDKTRIEPQYFKAKTPEECPLDSDGHLKTDLDDEKILVDFIPAAIRQTHQIIMKITVLLSMRNSWMSFFNRAYLIINTYTIGHCLIIATFLLFPNVPFGLWFIFQVYSLKTYEKLFGPSDKIEDNFWTFQVIQELKSQRPRKLRPRQYKKIMKKWEKGGLRVQITHLY